MSSRKARLLAAEAATGAIRRGGVMRLLPGETAEEALARAGVEGRTGSFLVVPPAMTETAWEAMAAQQQQALMVEAQEHLRGIITRDKRK